MHPKSDTLFHFTKSRETLKQILKGAFWPRYCLEDVGWLGYSSYDYIAYPMVCFCDIPLSRIADHVAFYGNFGVGVTREWGRMNGLNPVFYVSGENHVATALRDLNSAPANLTGNDDFIKQSKVTMRYIYAHTKPTIGNMVVDGRPVEKAFYQESEWRYIPKHSKVTTHLLKADFETPENLAKYNEKTRNHAMLEFAPKDVRYIFVKNDADIPDIINFIETELDHHPRADHKILMSRVISLESFSGDL